MVICPEGLGGVLLPDQTTAVALDGLLCVKMSWTSGQSTGVGWLYRHPGLTIHTLRGQPLHLVWCTQKCFWLHVLAFCAVHACIYSRISQTETWEHSVPTLKQSLLGVTWVHVCPSQYTDREPNQLSSAWMHVLIQTHGKILHNINTAKTLYLPHRNLQLANKCIGSEERVEKYSFSKPEM